jgi:hypothetical protein
MPKIVRTTCEPPPQLLDKRQQEKNLDFVNLDKTHAKTRCYPSQHQKITSTIAPSG